MKSSLSPRPASSSSPATSSSMPSVVSNDVNSEHGQNDDGQDISQPQKIPQRDRPHAPVANMLEHDDKRPHAPVAKLLLHENEKQQQQQQQQHRPESTGKSGSRSMIPNLLNSGAFPPPPHSPNRHHSLPSSPPTITSSPNITSPHIPAAPPTTPYTPFAERFSVPNFPRRPSSSSPPNEQQTAPSPPLPLFNNASPTATTTTTTNNNSKGGGPTITSLLNQQPFTTDPHTKDLLHQTLLQTQSNEQSRITQLLTHETQNYTTLSEYRHALSRERRHSLSLALELSYYKFLSKHTTCSLYSNLEMNEEARLNKLIKNIDDMKKNMTEDKIRVVMELEREEEGIVNGLMERLEGVRREKMILEQKFCSGGGGFGSGFGSGGDGDKFEKMVTMMEQQQQLQSQQLQQQEQQQGQQRGVPSLAGPFARMEVSAGSSSTQATPLTPSAIDVFPCLKEDEASDDEEEEEEDDEEEDSNDDDILEGRYHDAEMEEELEKILKMKESKK